MAGHLSQEDVRASIADRSGGEGVFPLKLRALFAGVLAAAALASGSEALAAPSKVEPLDLAVASPVDEYRIGALDKLSISVFQVKDLTLETVQVDASGQILLPLIGGLVARGKTAKELSAEIAAGLSKRFLQNPQVTVLVTEAASQRVTVEGAVVQAGVFQMSGPTSLLQAIAMARGPAKYADLKRVAIFRRVDGQRMAAVFDLRAVRSGKAEDPEVLASDVIVVPDSGVKGVLREIIGALPAIGVFAAF